MSDDTKDGEQPNSLNLDHINRMLLDSVGVGLAVADPESLRIIARNHRFEEWFPGVMQDESALPALFPKFEEEKMRSRLQAGRAYTHEVEVPAGRRKLNLLVSIEAGDGKNGPVLIVECHNNTKIKELEYMIESYSTMIEKQNRDLRREAERSEKLLLNIMPKLVYEEWKELGVTTPRRYDACSVLMLDFVDFTEMAISEDPSALIAELNDIFTAFDRIAEQFGCERIKTIGDAYVAVSGIPEETPEHAHNIAKLALRIVRYMTRRNEGHAQKWHCRVGINSGPLIGSIVGVQKYVYDIFGPGVNLAARMERRAGPMEIVLCDDMYELIKDSFQFESNGSEEIKGFGTKNLYILVDGGR